MDMQPPLTTIDFNVCAFRPSTEPDQRPRCELASRNERTVYPHQRASSLIHRHLERRNQERWMTSYNNYTGKQQTHRKCIYCRNRQEEPELPQAAISRVAVTQRPP